eukprot:TRINITY_DN15916_c0_g3_i1.p1 TRINITY_DN15916_c0_g3~~TRINITY_DN15916_c0_g3_i1.p1  ORF type:complete len:625 (+),score=145.33 TRINITY_DN15916_c0_g3_i1:465-2339(+)
MGANQSHADDFEEEEDEEEEFQDAEAGTTTDPGKAKKQAVAKKGPKLYRYSKQSSKWELADKEPSWKFVQLGATEDDDDEEEDDGESWKERRGNDGGKSEDWYLVVSKKIQARVDEQLNVRYNDDHFRVDFATAGVWALRFGNSTEYREFVRQFSDCLFENNFGAKATQANKTKIIGKDFLDWAAGEDGDEAMWDAEENPEEGDPGAAAAKLAGYEIRETFRGTPKGRDAQSLTMGALANSYVLHSTGLDVYRNRERGIEQTELSIRFPEATGGSPFSTPKKGMLIRGEATMMLMSPLSGLDSVKKKGVGGGGAGGVQQLDIDTGKIVSNWEFQKDGTPISMLDIVNDSKSSQLDTSQNTFLGLDDNRLCRWDMRAREGEVQNLTAATSSPSVLSWSDGHQFSRGTNFRCFATTGDGAIVVGSRDGKVRLYGTTSMRQAKTAFPGLGSPITNVDVTYDGHWIVATTDTYVLVICALFKDKDGREKTGFQGRMGGQFGAPRLLKLTPQDAEKAKALGGGGFKFSGAHFSWVTECDKAERNIVVSVGQYSVVWNFRRVKQSGHTCYTQGGAEGMKTCYCYKVSSRAETVVDSRFMHDSYMNAGSPDAALVVATPQEVTSQLFAGGD